MQTLERSDTEELLTADQVAELLQVHRNKVYDDARTGDLPSYRVGRSVRFRRSEVLAAIRSVSKSRDASTVVSELSTYIRGCIAKVEDVQKNRSTKARALDDIAEVLPAMLRLTDEVAHAIRKVAP